MEKVTIVVDNVDEALRVLWFNGIFVYSEEKLPFEIFTKEA
jgi:hypothetical protein